MLQKKKLTLAVALAAAVAAPSAFATTGYFSHGYSMKEKGMAGASFAYSQDALAAAMNPAGMVMAGGRADLGVALFSPSPRSYTTTGSSGGACFAPGQCAFTVGPQTIESDNDFFLIPQFGYNWMLDAVSSVGVSIYGNGGMNTEYQGGTATLCPTGDCPPGGGGATSPVTLPGTFGGGTTGVDLSQLFINVTYARKITPASAWGVSAIFAYQRFKAEGLANFAPYSTDPANLTNRGYDSSVGFGAKVGVQGEVAPGVSLGAAYQSEMKMDEFDKYKGLFAEQGGFDIPATAGAGVAWKVTPASVLTFDIQRIWYSKVNSVGNPMNPALTNCAMGVVSNCLGGSNGPGFGWKDINVYRLGYQWQMGPDWTWRVGYIKNDQPIPRTEVLFNILAPGVQEQHFTFGFTKKMGKTNELTFAAMYSPEEKVSGPNPLDPGQTIELKMRQYELGVAWSWLF